MVLRFSSGNMTYQSLNRPGVFQNQGLFLVMWFAILTIFGFTLVFGVSLIWLIVVLSLLICIVPFLMPSEESLILSPLYITMAYLAISYPIKFIAVRAGLEYVKEDYPGMFADETLMIKVFIVFIMGVISYLLGYYRPPRGLIPWLTSLRMPFSALPTGSWPKRIMVIFAIGWGIVILQMYIKTWSIFAGLGENWGVKTNQVFSYLFQYTWFAYIAAGLWSLSRRNDKSMSGLFICVIIIFGTITASLIWLGSKTWLIYSVYWIILGAFMVGRRPLVWLIAPILLLFILFTFSFTSSYRTIYLHQFGPTSNIGLGVFEVTKEAMINLDENSMGFTKPLGLMISRFGGIDNAAKVVSLFPDKYDYFYFYDISLFPLSIVPRAIFPQKPQPITKTFYSVKVAGMIYGGSAAPHPVAEGYLNLGFLGVIILFWIWGLIQSLLYRGFYLPRRDNFIVGTLYAYYMLQFVGFGGWFTGLITGLPGQFIVLIPLLLILNNQKASVSDMKDRIAL